MCKRAQQQNSFSLFNSDARGIRKRRQRRQGQNVNNINEFVKPRRVEIRKIKTRSDFEESPGDELATTRFLKCINFNELMFVRSSKRIIQQRIPTTNGMEQWRCVNKLRTIDSLISTSKSVLIQLTPP